MTREELKELCKKPDEESIRDGHAFMRKVEEYWFSLPEETRNEVLGKSLDTSYVLSSMFSNNTASFGRHMMKVGYYIAKKEG